MGMLQGARANIPRCLIPCLGKTTPARRIRTVARVRATTTPETSRTWIRDAFGKRHHLTIGDGVHVHRAYDIPVAFKSTDFASPVPPFRLMTMAAYGTLAGCTSFVANEAHDAVLFRLLLQVINIPAVLPLAYALVVVTPGVLASYPIGVADEKGFDAALLAEIHHLAGPLMAQVADAALTPQGQCGACFAQFPPAPGTLRTAGALTGHFAKLFAVLTLQGAKAAPGDNQGLAGIGGHRRLMDLAEIDRRLATRGLETREVHRRGIGLR